uniref:ZP domain-containing protein n=1 Tax=Parastrongyloides trichosuri TaxID=131310 RepID=A0A0N5A1B8_PARTI
MINIVSRILLFISFITIAQCCIPLGMPGCDCQQNPSCNSCLSKSYYYNYDHQPSVQQYAYPTLIETNNALPTPPTYLTNEVNQENVVESNFPGMENYLTTPTYTTIPQQNTPEYFEADRILANSIKKLNREEALKHNEDIIKNNLHEEGSNSFKIESSQSSQDSAMNYPTAQINNNVNTEFAITVENRNNNTKETYNNYYKGNSINSGDTQTSTTISPIPSNPNESIYKIKHEIRKDQKFEEPIQSLYYGFKSYPISKASLQSMESNFTFKSYPNNVCNGITISKNQEPSLAVALDKCFILNCDGFNIRNDSSINDNSSSIEVVYLQKIDDKISLQGYSCLTSKFF